MASLENTTWPLPKFYFLVKGMPGDPVFQAVTGPESEAQVIEYRAGNSPIFAPIKMPGLQKVGNVTMKKGVYKGDNKFFEWFKEIKMNTVKRKPITISLLDENGDPAMTWTLLNAWPSKITATDLKAEGNEVAIETIEIVHEGLEIAKA